MTEPKPKVLIDAEPKGKASDYPQGVVVVHTKPFDHDGYKHKTDQNAETGASLEKCHAEAKNLAKPNMRLDDNCAVDSTFDGPNSIPYVPAKTDKNKGR